MTYTPDRLTLVTHALSGGGAERVIAWLAGEMSRLGWRVTILVVGDAAEGRYTTDERVDVRCLRMERRSVGLLQALTNNLHRVHALRAALRRSAADVVLSFGDTTNVTTLLASVGERWRVVVSERTEPRRHEIPRPWRILRRLLYPYAARVVVQTNSVAVWAREFISTERVAVIRNVPLKHRAGSVEVCQLPDRYVLGVGRLEPVKRFDFLIRSFSAASRGDGSWHLVLAGEGGQRAALSDQARGLGIGDRVHLLGRVADLHSVYDRASIFCLTSAYEGCPNALLEAMQSGVACLAVDCLSGPSEMIEHGVDGVIVAEGDDDAFVAALSRLMRDEELRRRLGVAASARAARDTPEDVAMQWHSLLTEAIGDGS